MSELLHLVLADTEVELVPQEIAGHPQVRSHADSLRRRAPKIVLDSSHHHAAMKGLPEAERRGRPDILHAFLLVALESRINKAGLLRVHIHTRQDRLITVDPTTRVIRHFPRFVGLVEQLYEKGRVPRDGPALLSIEDGVSLSETVKRTGASSVVALETDGEPVPPGPATRSLLAHPGAACFVIGGFPHGTYRSPIREVAPTVVAFGREPLAVWTVAGEILAHAGAVLVDKN